MSSRTGVSIGKRNISISYGYNYFAIFYTKEIPTASINSTLPVVLVVALLLLMLLLL